ncbi:MAG: hypothetical protein Sylvanvirus16_8 [Sylvanvirus sp.]|uniref:Uncharacterized protein n=1 Tax=Sylvanvirus sp. TaxID=2487774 RepID=A0A3G5AID7_9VIRU|nr:MAG: hypothetical protein Sylvanvirus16_8 [Sylvanvirus sp.]
MFQQFPQEGCYAGVRREIIDSSRQGSCKNCQKWASSDPECHLYTYHEESKQCTKLKTLHRHGHELAIMTDAVPLYDQLGQMTGQFTKPQLLTLTDTDFEFSAQHHEIKFVEEDATNIRDCFKRALETPGVRFLTFNPHKRQVIAISRSMGVQDSQVIMGVRRGKSKHKQPMIVEPAINQNQMNLNQMNMNQMYQTQLQAQAQNQNQMNLNLLSQQASYPDMNQINHMNQTMMPSPIAYNPALSHVPPHTLPSMNLPTPINVNVSHHGHTSTSDTMASTHTPQPVAMSMTPASQSSSVPTHHWSNQITFTNPSNPPLVNASLPCSNCAKVPLLSDSSNNSNAISNTASGLLDQFKNAQWSTILCFFLFLIITIIVVAMICHWMMSGAKNQGPSTIFIEPNPSSLMANIPESSELDRLLSQARAEPLLMQPPQSIQSSQPIQSIQSTQPTVQSYSFNPINQQNPMNQTSPSTRSARSIQSTLQSPEPLPLSSNTPRQQVLPSSRLSSSRSISSPSRSLSSTQVFQTAPAKSNPFHPSYDIESEGEYEDEF